jgi:hypothetical protein
MGAPVTAFEAYQTYLALKQHFTKPGYDFFKYNGKVKVQASSFDVRKDKYQFHKLSKHTDPINYLVSNFVYNDIVNEFFYKYSCNDCFFKATLNKTFFYWSRYIEEAEFEEYP